MCRFDWRILILIYITRIIARENNKKKKVSTNSIYYIGNQLVASAELSVFSNA